MNTYTVVSNGKIYTIEATSFTFNTTEQVVFYDDTEIIAVFNNVTYAKKLVV